MYKKPYILISFLFVNTFYIVYVYSIIHDKEKQELSTKYKAHIKSGLKSHSTIFSMSNSYLSYP